MSNTPSDAEIDEVTLDVLGYAALDKETNETARMIARAVLAKWGTPQPVVREPLTDEHIRAMLNKHPPEAVCDWSYRMGIDDAELHHGIKGGQHEPKQMD